LLSTQRLAFTQGGILRRIFACQLLIAALVGGGPTEAQQQAKVPKVGLLRGRASASGTSLDGVVGELRALGYVDGKNIAFESRSAENKLDRLPALAEELVGLKVDLLLVPATVEALVAKNATRNIPIVCLNIGDPVALGLVNSFARPGGNITGFTAINAVLTGKRLEILKETIPKLSRVTVLLNPQDTSVSELEWKESQLAARELGLQLHSMDVSTADKLDGAFKEATKARSEALVLTLQGLFSANQKRIADLAVKNRLPAIYPRGDFVDSGGLMSYGADPTESFKRVASMVDKILKGTKPADLPVEQPTKFEFVINLKAAKQIGLTIPPNVLARADRVIR
jgi:putative tryptophan/tyrosine transport system substrate-binding protein